MTTSIVIPILGNWPLVDRCLSHLVQTTGPDVEVICVDNGSPGDSGVREGLLKWQAESDLNLRPIFLPSNLGFAGGCNAGLHRAEGNVVVFLNSDAFAHPGWLEPLLLALHDPTIGLVGSLLLYENGTVQHAGMAVDRNLHTVHFHRNADPDSIPGIRRAKDLQFVTGACIALRRRDAIALNGFDEGYKIGGYEDLDLNCRIRAKGMRVRYEPASVLTHLEGQTPGRTSHEGLNAARFYQRWIRTMRVDLDTVVAADLEPDAENQAA